MGFAITWCAVREEQAQKVLDQLGLRPTGETEKFPKSLVSAAKLDTGWRVIWYNQYGCPFLRAEDLARISQDHDVLMCLVEEHVMASSSELWSSGARRWWICHEGLDSPKGLSTAGAVPECFASIRSELEEAQRAEGGRGAGVDHIFEIPLKVAQSIVGFKHDEDCPHLAEGHFIVLTDGRPKQGFWGKLFG
jgi:hypothetical protein